MVTATQARQFWTVVEACLVELGDKPRSEATTLVAKLKAILKERGKPQPGEPDFSDLIYHAEPLHVASDLAGRELAEGKAAQLRYDKIRRHLQVPVRTSEEFKTAKKPTKAQQTVTREMAVTRSGY